MFEKNMTYTYLLDTYGPVLDEGARAIMEAYYNEDLSLAEIADGIGISRQGVRHSIKRCEELLDRYESSLHLCEMLRAQDAMADRLTAAEECLRTYEDSELTSVADTLRQISHTLRGNR